MSMDIYSLKKKAENAGVRQGDLFVIALLLALAVLLLCLGLVGEKTGSRVRICVDGEETAVLSLAEDRVYTVPGGMGNVLEIADGCVRMTAADCPDKSCVRQGGASRVGECIVCLPARVTVTIISDDGAEGLDAVAY